jgi:phosphotransferase system HPr-like phosphotransfer protein
MTTDFLTLFDSKENQEIISEEKFGRILEPFAGPFLSLSNYVEEALKGGSSKLLDMEFLANVIKHSSDVEHFLDLYRARNNRNWSYFREIAATTKNFGKAAFLLEELKKNSHAELLLPQDSNFVEMAETAGLFFAEIISRSFRELQAEARRLNLTVPKERPLRSDGVKLHNEIILPHTIEEAAASDKAHMVKKLVHGFAEFAEEALSLEKLLQLEGGSLTSKIPGELNEGTLRRLGTRLHNFQSWYDTHIDPTGIGGEIPELKGLREIFHAQLNLFKIATISSHYFERHLVVPSSPVVDRLRHIVPPSGLVEGAFRFSLYFLMKLFRTASELADSILNRLVDIVTYELPIPEIGFHARPSTRVAKVVQHYGSDVKMLVEDQVFDAGSVLQMLSAGGYIVTKRLDKVRFRGDRQALNDIKILAEHNYGETRKGKDIPLPDTLSYLK